MIIKGDLPINIRWTLNEVPIVSGENGITVVKLSAKTSVLNMAAVETEHRGIVKCIAENLAGAAEYSSELRVNGTHKRFKSTLIYLEFNLYLFFLPPMGY